MASSESGWPMIRSASWDAMRAAAAPAKDEAFRRLREVKESCFTTPFYEIGK
jgi:hypothetical protein